VNNLFKWVPNYQEFQDLFANEYSLMILIIIHQQSQKNEYLCAAEIAKILNIHISTVTKYLDILNKNRLVQKEQDRNKPGKPTYYKTQVTTLSVTLELPEITQELEDILEEPTLPNPLVREKPNLHPRVIYEFDDNGLIRSIVLKQKTKAKRTIKRKIVLSSYESNFMKYLPHPTLQSNHFQDICHKAGITDTITMIKLLDFLNKLEKYCIIENYETKVK
jgi:predicted transcriptional regulator